MQIARNASTRLLHNRRIFLLLIATTAIALAACRGSGSDPSASDQGLPVLQPTPSDSQCIDHVQPPGAPTFDQLDLSRLELQEEDLSFYDVEQGTGDSPAITDAITVEYTGWLDNGCMFDTSYPNGEPVNFIMLNLIRGWQQSFATMKEGGTRVMEIGPSLAYRDVGFPPRIPPNATLIFHVTLLNRITIEEAQATVQAEIAEATAQADRDRATVEAGDETPTPTP